MFAGKTSKAISLSDGCGSTIYFKTALDNRYSADDIVTHDNIARPALVLRNMSDCDNYMLLGKIADNIVIDEVQFFNDFIVQAIKEASILGYNVFVTGLNYWADGSKPVIVEELRKLDGINEIKLKARCSCGSPAEFTAKMVGSLDNIVEVGGSKIYQPKCKKCFREIRRKQKGVK
jgi:thymidine kinase